ncbi:MAG: molybdenum cofactor guanylyltransferase MobA [Rhodospirillales bacterium]|nr:molybdenum cofactor guanylyltransferase MobA [Rhodospirillales bacterium]
MEITGLVLAGGLARRMGGGDKALRRVGGKPLLDYVVATLRPQVSELLLNANGDSGRFAAWTLPVVADGLADYPGPLAGILAGLEWLRDNRPGCPWLLSVPTDTPFLPGDLAARLAESVADGKAELACARSDGQVHPVVGLWPVTLAGDLRRALTEENLRKIDRWTARHRLAVVDFPCVPVDPFLNVNTPEDVTTAEALLMGESSCA